MDLQSRIDQIAGNKKRSAQSIEGCVFVWCLGVLLARHY